MMMLPLFFLAACSAPQDAPPRVVEPRPFTTPAERGEAQMRDTMLRLHNIARHAVGMPPLAWDDALGRDAATYARDLARRGAFEHSKQPRGPAAQGENLWTGTRGAYRYDEMAQHWIDERRDYVPGVVPNLSRTGKFGDVGHYTQIVWRTTTRMGCAMASNRRDDVLVCRYSPAGNVWGQSPLP